MPRFGMTQVPGPDNHTKPKRLGSGGHAQALEPDIGFIIFKFKKLH
jgi:hypothetical protein